ncbi:MAG: hypothetical protein JW854_10160 [Actinobacteria bacterium]|nr:hypothetical protein [Actinomycetota bacterium]
MASMRRDRKEALEASAASFLSQVETPGVSRRLSDYGLQRVWARAEKLREAKAPAAARRASRNPALLRHVIVVAVVVIMVMLVSTTGAYAISYNAQPDSPLYGTKIFFERARITLTPSSAEDIRLEISFSERRMEELQSMVSSGNDEGADRWLREYRRNVEGAGVLLDTISSKEAEELSTQFQEMLDRQAHVMQGMGQGQPLGLSEPIEDAYRVCDEERMRMRQRSGQQGQGNPQQEPGGHKQEGNCPASHETSLQEEPGTVEETGVADESPVSENTHSRLNTEAPVETSPAADDVQENGYTMAEEGAGQQGAGYQEGGMRRGCVP